MRDDTGRETTSGESPSPTLWTQSRAGAYRDLPSALPLPPLPCYRHDALLVSCLCSLALVLDCLLCTPTSLAARHPTWPPRTTRNTRAGSRCTAWTPLERLRTLRRGECWIRGWVLGGSRWVRSKVSPRCRTTPRDDVPGEFSLPSSADDATRAVPLRDQGESTSGAYKTEVSYSSFVSGDVCAIRVHAGRDVSRSRQLTGTYPLSVSLRHLCQDSQDNHTLAVDFSIPGMSVSTVDALQCPPAHPTAHGQRRDRVSRAQGGLPADDVDI